MIELSLKSIESASNRIKDYVKRTPILSSEILNGFLGHSIFFKAEGLQKTGAFKIRGGLNTVSWLIENNMKPEHIVTNSSGNHAQAVAMASAIFRIKSTVYMPQNVSAVKAQAAESYGAEIIYCLDRIIADREVEKASKSKNVYWIPPFNHEQVIAGQGTAAYEALKELTDINAVFAPCGGGGLLSGTLIAARGLSPGSKVIGVEPKNANDAYQSLKKGKIVKFDRPPHTIADGARTLSIGDITFHYLNQLDDFYEATEEKIIYWTQWLTHLLKIQVEPTSAMAMVGVVKWLKAQKNKKRVLVILSGANIDNKTNKMIWEKDYLSETPSINI
jgi:threonine dehydratase